MPKKVSSYSVINLFRKQVITSIYLIVICLGVIAVFYEISWLSHMADQERNLFYDAQRDQIKQEVQKVTDFIKLSSKEFMHTKNKELESKTKEAWTMAHAIYSRYNGSLPKSEIQRMIIETLRPIRFFEGRGYFFIADTNGFEFLNPYRPDLEGKNLREARDARGNLSVDQVLRLLRKQDEGFLTGYWPKPSSYSKEAFEKRSFIKAFEPFGWYIGCGEYVDEIERILQQEVIELLDKVRFGVNNRGHIFINELSGEAIIIQSKEFKRGDFIYNLKDANGFNVFKEQKRLALEEDGGYMDFLWQNEGEEKPTPQVAYIDLIDEWGWIIGATARKDDIEKFIQLQRKEIKKTFPRRILFGVMLLIAIILSFNVLIKRLHERVKRQILHFLVGVDRAFGDRIPIKPDEFEIKEFIEMGESVNIMLKEQIDAEKRLKESEEKFRTIYENVPVMITGFRDKEVVLWNKECERVFELSINDIRSNPDPWSLFYKEDEFTEVKDFMRKSEGDFRLFKVKGKNGEHLYQLWASFKTDGGVTINVGHDITDLKQYEIELKESNEFLNSLINSIPSPVFYKNKEGVYQLGNEKLAELINVPIDKIKGLTVYDVTPEEFAFTYDEIDKQVMEEGKSILYETIIHTDSVTDKYFMVNKAVHKNLEGEKEGIIGIMQDITPRREMELKLKEREKELLEKDKVKNRFFSIISHDLKNPFTPLMGFTQILLQNYEQMSDEEKLELIQHINESSEGLHRLLMNLLEWSKGQLHGHVTQPERFNIYLVVQDVFELMKEQALAKNIELKNALKKDLRVFADPNMIETVVRNLVNNSVKFTTDGTIRVLAVETEEEVILRVTDTGVGMPEEAQKKLFKLEEKVSTVGTSNEKGTGLGLILCKEFIDANKGDIWCESKLGQGTSFYVKLPK